MWYGKDTEELILAKKEYESKFGYNPDAEIEVEYFEYKYKEYIEDIKKCIKKVVSISILYD